MTKRAPLEQEKLLTPAEFSAAWGICTMTATRWANRGYVQVRHTLGGHRRFLASETPAAIAHRRADRERRLLFAGLQNRKPPATGELP